MLERSVGKDYRTVSLPSVFSIFEKLVNNRLSDHLEKCFFSDYQYGFRSPRLTEDLLSVGTDSITRAFNMSGATRPSTFNLLKEFVRV